MVIGKHLLTCWRRTYGGGFSIEKLQANIPGIVERVRAGIVVMERDNLFLQQETKSLRALYENTLAENQSLNDRVFNDQITIDNLQKQLMSYNNLEDQLKKVCEERDLTRSQKQWEKQRLKAELKHKLQSESEKLRKEMLSCLKEREQKLKHKTYQCQVRALQEIFDKDDVIPPPSAPAPEKDPHLSKPQP
ncbi:uncharacterized protein LOC121864057, partial [Homarus americanus]|uniref:uncharacterized protein LOC121864057 n=1 Tax=Homarus americanus TaxID=6706 RepID=UPI001C485ED9